MREEVEALLRVPVGEVSGRPAEGRRGSDTLPDTAVLVGTAAVLHRVRHAAAVAFLDFDQHLLAPRYLAGEEALALIARAGRLVGGRQTRGRGDPGVVMVQTRLPTHDVLRAAVAGDPGMFTELELRKTLRLPPYSAFATVRSEVMPHLEGQDVEVSPLGAGTWLVRAPDHRTLCDAVAPLHGGVGVDPDEV